MTVSAARFPDVWRKSFASRLATFLTILAFAMQSFVVQTHIHPGAQGHSGIVKVASATGPAQGKTPLGNSKEACPFCQAVAHAGAVLTPDMPVFFVPVWVLFETHFVVTRVVARADAHGWQSRAPPPR